MIATLFLLSDQPRESLVKTNVIQEVNSRKSHSMHALWRGNIHEEYIRYDFTF
jgi:hypothetical protein